MNKNIILALIFLISFKENICSYSQLDETLSQPDTEILSQPDTEISSFRNQKLKIIVNWTAVKDALERQSFVWEKSESYTQIEGCGTDQKFISFSSEFKKIPTEVLINSLNKKEKVIVRQ